MNQINIQYYKSKIGDLIIGSFAEKLCLLDFRHRKMRTAVDKRIKNGLKADFVEKNDPVIERAKKQLNEYFIGERKVFDVALLTVGTVFQKSVWNALLKVSYGERSTYLQIANKINNEKAVRAVAGAIGANSILFIIPCHRIIGNDGELVGYSGGLTIKKRLLQLESNNAAV